MTHARTVVAPLLAAAVSLLSASPAAAKTVTLAMDVKLDQVAPEDAQMYRVGGHDLDRVSYDDSQIDPVTKRVRITSLSHYIAGKWLTTEPTDASTLDLSRKPYRLSFVASVTHGRAIVALFEADTMRMAMLARPDFHVLIAGQYTIDPTPLTDPQVAAPPPNAKSPDTMPMMSGMSPAALSTTPRPDRAVSTIVALDVDIVLDQVSPDEKGMTVGQHHEARVFFDKAAIDPVTRRVALLHEQHTPALVPKHLNPAQMPISNAWLDFSGDRIRYHFAAAPTVAIPYPYFILFDENTMRMTIRKQSDGSLLLAGPYTVNPKEITGPEIDAVVSTSEPVVPPWDTTMKMPAMPNGPRPR